MVYAFISIFKHTWANLSFKRRRVLRSALTKIPTNMRGLIDESLSQNSQRSRGTWTTDQLCIYIYSSRVRVEESLSLSLSFSLSPLSLSNLCDWSTPLKVSGKPHLISGMYAPKGQTNCRDFWLVIPIQGLGEAANSPHHLSQNFLVFWSF